MAQPVRLAHRVPNVTSALLSLALLSVLAGSASAQGRRVRVEVFDQSGVAGNIGSLFGGNYDLGRGLQQLVRDRLNGLGVEVVETPDAEGTASGTILVYGREQSGTDLGGVNVGGIRLGLGRRQETAVVVIEARLVDAASGEILTIAMGRGESSRSSMDAFASRRGAQLASIDLSSEEFRETSIGEATHQAVNSLAAEIQSSVSRIGTVAVRPAPSSMPTSAAPAVDLAAFGQVTAASGPVGSFAWAPYQFRGTERFRYEVRQTDGDQVQTGFYTLALEPAGDARIRMTVQGRLGEEEYSSSITTATGPEGVQAGMMQFMTLGPIGITLFNPTAWIMLGGRELTVGDGWSSSSGGDSMSVRVESTCGYAGQDGVDVVLRANEEVVQQTCVSPSVALPLRAVTGGDGFLLELVLSQYQP